MSDETIRAALEAAIDAAWPGNEAIYADEHASPAAMMAAAIAAFLRDVSGNLCAYANLDKLAAAVERAAKAPADA